MYYFFFTGNGLKSKLIWRNQIKKLIVVRDGNQVPADGHEESFCGDGYVETLDCGESTRAL